MPFNFFPAVDRCCGCITDLKTATAIIAVLAIVTSPAVSWAVVRHSYVIRVACFVSTSISRADVIDVNLNNVLSFGFGANAGLGPSCLNVKPSLNKSVTEHILRTQEETKENSLFLTMVKYLGWLVLAIDVVLLAFSINLLVRLFQGGDKKAAYWFLITAALSIGFSFLYGILYVTACMTSGGSFPIFEFIFAIIDLGIWIYFLIIVQSYRRSTDTNQPPIVQRRSGS